MEVGGMLPSHSQEEISPIKEGDYVGEDGLIRCGVCGKRKQFKIEISGFKKIVPCICKCRSDEIEKEKQKDEYEQRMHAINRLKDASMMASKFRDANFSGYKVREENQEAYKLALNYVKKFREMKEKNQGLLLYGPVGTGKSFTAACIANALMEQNITVIMTSFVKILQDIGTGDEASYIQILNSASLLIIDDLGAERNTDYALEKAVGWGAKVILSVPCCQHELNRQIHNPVLQPVLEYGLLKERMAALYTDGIRAKVLEYRGYNTQILEFIDMEHTPKNILLRAVLRKEGDSEGEKKKETGEQIRELIHFLNIDPAIVRLLAPEL